MTQAPIAADLPIVKMRSGHITEIVDQAELELVRIGRIYNRGGELVRAIRLEKIESKAVRRAQGSVVIVPVNDAWLIEHMSLHMKWYSYSKTTSKWVLSDPKPIYARTLMGRGEWRMPILRGVCTTPIVTVDGRIIQAPGYDEESGLLLDLKLGDYPPVPENPTKDQCAEALTRVLRPLRGFPFVDETARAIAASALLTALMRPALRTAPLHGFDAPVAGTGKSYLAEAAGMLATGCKPPAMSQGKTDEEDEKRLAVVLHANDRVLHIDNCDRALSGDFLCSMLTQETVQARILGQSERRILPTCTFVMASGNNLAVLGDMTRRVVLCRLDAKTERPDSRAFDFDCHREIMADRAQLVVDCLTLIRGFVVAGKPVQLTPMGSFNDWEVVRGALVWLGMSDPASMRDTIFSDDPKRDELSTVIAMWHKAFGLKKVSVADIAEAQSDAAKDLFQKFIETACRGVWSSKSVGWWLKRNRHKIVGQLRFSSEMDLEKHQQTWFLENSQGSLL